MNLYNIIEQTIREHIPQVSVSIGTTQDDVYQCIRSIMRDNPDIFWFSHQWKYTEADQTIRFHYTMDRERSLKAKAQIEDVVQNDFHINEMFHLPTAEKVMYVYKWLALYCKYNIYSAYNQTIYSVFVCRNSVCTGYAKAAQYLFKVLGIESRLVFGKMRNAEKGSRHCWLVVKIVGVWYHIDPTFAVPEINDLLVKAGVDPVFGADGLVYNYFCCDTKTIKLSRTIEDEEELPECNSNIDYKSLQNLTIKIHRNEGTERMGVRGCLLSDSGHFASVYLWHSENNVQSVVKVYKHDSSHELLWHECRIMREMAASNAVVHACGVTDSEDGLIIEQATPLADLLCSHYYQLSATNFCKLLIDVLSGLQDCIKHEIYYRDIHLNNIYRTSQGRYVLGDFGSCIWMERENPSNIGGIGSPWYVAPETYKDGFFDERSAIYGIGMLAYFLLNELQPPLWAEYGEQSLKHRIDGEKLAHPALLKGLSCAFEKQMASVILKSLTYNPDGRYQKLSDLEKAIKQCMSLVEDDDYLLIDGGSSERLFMFDGKDKSGRYKHNGQVDFCSTCVDFPDILVSNGENEPIVVDVDGVGQENWIANDYPETPNNDYGELVPPSPPGRSEECLNRRSRIDDFATTDLPSPCLYPEPLKTYQPSYNKHLDTESSKGSIWKRLFGSKKHVVNEDEVFSSVFAPAEVKLKSHFMVQVYLHLYEETENIAHLAIEADPKAERRKYTPLSTKLKVNDKVTVELNIYGESLLQSYYKDLTWRGRFTQCTFDYFVPTNLDIEELSCEVNLYVNGALVGDMRFLTNIVERPRKLNSEIISRMFKRIFISYAHQDSVRVRDFALAYKAQGVDYFFDRDKLGAGDVFEEKIFEYIDSADLFILCWSANAANSEYVRKERRRAMLRAYPQLSHHEATLKIYPISIEPRTELPQDMAGIYNFEEV